MRLLTTYGVWGSFNALCYAIRLIMTKIEFTKRKANKKDE